MITIEKLSKFHPEIKDILRPMLAEIENIRVSKPGKIDSKVIVDLSDGLKIVFQFIDGHWKFVLGH